MDVDSVHFQIAYILKTVSKKEVKSPKLMAVSDSKLLG